MLLPHWWCRKRVEWTEDIPSHIPGILRRGGIYLSHEKNLLLSIILLVWWGFLLWDAMKSRTRGRTILKTHFFTPECISAEFPFMKGVWGLSCVRCPLRLSFPIVRNRPISRGSLLNQKVNPLCLEPRPGAGPNKDSAFAATKPVMALFFIPVSFRRIFQKAFIWPCSWC